MPGILNRKSRWAIWWLHAAKVGQWTIVIALGYVVLRSVLCRFLDQFGQAEQRLFSISPTNFVRHPARVGRESNRRLLGGAAFCDHAIFFWSAGGDSGEICAFGTLPWGRPAPCFILPAGVLVGMGSLSYRRWRRYSWVSAGC